MYNEGVPLGLRNADFDHRAKLLNAEISGILAVTLKLTYDFVVHTAPSS